ncbi:KY peptidase, partial [Amia calva]|nr:KY peptidase [Amia calva]
MTECNPTEHLLALLAHILTEYDVKGLHNANLRSTDPEDILRTGKGVCAGYSALFQKMCSLAGVECVVISGYAKGINYFQGMSFKGDSNHAWNAVKLQGRWHLLDSTWGAGDVNDDHFTFKYKEFYFLTHPALFIGNHFPKEGTWQLLNPRVSLRQFENALYKCNTFYDLGLLSITPDSPVIQAGGNGKVTVEVESSTPRLFIHDLNGNTQYGLIMLKPNGMKLDVYPQAPGKHCLKIYGKDSEARNSYGFVCEYQVHCKAINTEMRLPADITNPVGPSWLTESKGLRQPSQRQPLIHTEDGKCSFRFLVDRNVQFMACLAAATFSMNEDEKRRHVFLSREGNWLEIRVQLPRAGLYVLNIYSKTQADPSKHYSFICNYLISCTNTKVMWPVFPLAYATWEEDYELVEPLAGVLPANRTVHFKMKIPHVAAVLVGARDHKLSLDTNGYWTGSCSTQGCTDLNVMIKKNPNDCSYSFVLSYQVEKN